jgi:hypothetical protein
LGNTRAEHCLETVKTFRSFMDDAASAAFSEVGVSPEQSSALSNRYP